jgi:hypothetical protein
MSTIIQARPSTGSGAPARPAPRPNGRLRTLKGQFILYALLLAVLAGALTLVSSLSLHRASSDLTTIDSGSIPSVNAALDIEQLIETIDAQSADFLAAANLTALTTCSLAGQSGTQRLTVHTCDERNIDAETVLVNQQLYEAAHNVTYVGERTAVERITIGLESYLGDIHQMRVDYSLAKSVTDPTDPLLQQAYQAYMAASAILNNQISLATISSRQIPFTTETNLPTCVTGSNQTLTPTQWTQGGLTTALDCLSSINYTHLSSAYNDSATFLTGATWALGILCAIFCLLLLFTGLRLLVVSHRLLNPGVLAAVIIGIALSANLLLLFSDLGAQSSQAINDGVFKQLVLDDYNSVYYAALLQRYGTDANADESRWLIAQEFGDQASIQHWQSDWDTNVQQIERLINQAHANQTWVEELQPLADMDTFWRQYDATDSKIRSAATAQDQSLAQRLFNAETISTGSSDQEFTSFSDAVQRLSNANQAHYEQTLTSAQGSLSLAFVLCLILFPLAGLLVVGGIAWRLPDF